MSVHPWLDDPDLGPGAVDAGPCDRCDDLPRIVAPCGPVAWRGLCRDCLLEVGVEAFCNGHVDEAVAAIARSRELPDVWDTLVRLTWVASGQVTADRAWLELAADRLADPTVAELVAPGRA